MSERDPDLPQPLRIVGIEISAQDQSPLVLLLVAVIQKQATEIGVRFDAMCSQRTGDVELNQALGLLSAKREEFLAVLEHRQLPLHNNLSENDIREYARLRKVSGGTRSDMGRRCRSTFMSAKKTCRNHLSRKRRGT